MVTKPEPVSAHSHSRVVSMGLRSCMLGTFVVSVTQALQVGSDDRICGNHCKPAQPAKHGYSCPIIGPLLDLRNVVASRFLVLRANGLESYVTGQREERQCEDFYHTQCTFYLSNHPTDP